MTDLRDFSTGERTRRHCRSSLRKSRIVQSRLKELERKQKEERILRIIHGYTLKKEAEAEAVRRILKIAKCADVPVIIVNLSTAAGYREIFKKRNRSDRLCRDVSGISSSE